MLTGTRGKIGRCRPSPRPGLMHSPETLRGWRAPGAEWRRVWVRRPAVGPIKDRGEFSCGFLQEFAQSFLCIVQSRFYRAECRAGYGGAFFEREFLEEMEQQHGAVRQRQLVQPLHEITLLLLPDEQLVRA